MDTSERLDVISDTKDLVGDPPQPAERDEHPSADSVDPFEKTDGAEPLLELHPVSGLLQEVDSDRMEVENPAALGAHPNMEVEKVGVTVEDSEPSFQPQGQLVGVPPSSRSASPRWPWLQGG